MRLWQAFDKAKRKIAAQQTQAKIEERKRAREEARQNLERKKQEVLSMDQSQQPAAIAKAQQLRAQVVELLGKSAAERFDGLRPLAVQYSDVPYLRDLLLQAALAAPITALLKALKIAPWWGSAYFNLARAEEMQGKYEAAILNLKRYLSLKPADAGEVRALLAKIDAEEYAAERR